jgi:hypothetical protein
MSIIERREAKRFKVGWTIKISAMGRNGQRTEETGILRDLSSTGAYGLFTKRFEVGSSVRVAIRLPLMRKGWISYSARILRIESGAAGSGIAFIFDAVRPSFMKDS